MKTIRYELKSLNTFVIRAYITQLDKTLGPVIIKIFSFEYKKNTKKKICTKNKKSLVARFLNVNKVICDHSLMTLTGRQ